MALCQAYLSVLLFSLRSLKSLLLLIPSDRNLRYFSQISSNFQQGQWYQGILLYLEAEILEFFFFFLKIEYGDLLSGGLDYRLI